MCVDITFQVIDQSFKLLNQPIQTTGRTVCRSPNTRDQQRRQAADHNVVFQVHKLLIQIPQPAFDLRQTRLFKLQILFDLRLAHPKHTADFIR